MKEAILLTDGYKLDHRRQYPEGTEYVYSNWTPRSCHYYPEAKEGAVVFGIQYFIKEYLMKQFQENFFNKPKDVAVAEFKRRVDTFLGPNNVGTKHIEELHDLGYLPIRIKALPEGTLCPIRVPALTFINTHPDFFWLTNYFETLISTTLWLPMTSATTARLYKKELIRHARKTGFKDVDLNFLIHDFSMRGMAGVDDAVLVTGAVWYNPFTETIYEYPTYVQTVDYEPFTINAQDGSEFTVDPTVSLKIVDGKSPAVFKKYRKGLTDVIHSTLYNYVKDAFRIQLNQFSTDYIVSHRDSIERAIETYLSKSLTRENFQLEQLTSGLKYPKTIVDAVDAKNKAVQEAMKVQNEVEVAKAEAEKLLVKARAEKEANELRTQALTPAVLEKMWIEKWDGKLPVYGQVPTIFKDISK